MEGTFEVEDGEFLSQLAAVEAEAASISKRRKLSSTDTSPVVEKKEGAYLAALRGSKSETFQFQAARNSSSYSLGLIKSNPYGYYKDDDAFVKECPCGLGTCLVLTANTERNRGRKFYKCPLRPENGGCSFFEWCDQSPEMNELIAKNQSAPNSSVKEFPCPCGAGSCRILTTKKGENAGRQFYRCPSNERSCSFFKWCDADSTTTDPPDSSGTPQVSRSINDMKVKSYNSGNSCFKCGKEGHWAKNCTSPSFHSPTAGVSGSCFKCGKPGHWAKNCSLVADPQVPDRK